MQHWNLKSCFCISKFLACHLLSISCIIFGARHCNLLSFSLSSGVTTTHCTTTFTIPPPCQWWVHQFLLPPLIVEVVTAYCCCYPSCLHSGHQEITFLECCRQMLTRNELRTSLHKPKTSCSMSRASTKSGESSQQRDISPRCHWRRCHRGLSPFTNQEKAITTDLLASSQWIIIPET